MDTALIALSVSSMLVNTIMLYQVISQISTWKRAAVALWFNAVVFNVIMVVVAGRIS